MEQVNTRQGSKKIEDAISDEDYLLSFISGNGGVIPLPVLRAALNIGGVIRPKRTVTSDDIITEDDFTVLIDGTNNTVDLSFPADPNDRQIFVVFCIDSTFTCTVLRNGKNINGAAIDKPLLATESISAQYDAAYGWLIF